MTFCSSTRNVVAAGQADRMTLIRQVRETIEQHCLLLPGDTVVVGVSGGPDSLCLLHVLRQVAPDYGVALHAAHLDHGIRAHESEQDARFVAELCRDWGVPCTVERADVPALAHERGLAIEEAARQARYVFLAATARRVGGRSVALAHHADDQGETVLMHFLRGSGLAGLRGMRPLSWVDELRLGEQSSGEPGKRLRLVRPLLYITRQEIQDYCREHDIEPRYDLSNLDRTYYRNRLRHDLIPLLETYNPNVREIVRRTAEVIAADYDVLRDLLDRAWPTVTRRASSDAIVFDLAALRALPLGLQRSVLREAVHRLRLSLRNINWAHIDDAVMVLNRGDTGDMATLPQGLLLTLGYDEATLAPESYAPEAENRPCVRETWPVPAPGSAPLGGGWRLTTQERERSELPAGWERNDDPWLAYLDADLVRSGLAVRPRRAGDRFVPLGLGHRQKVNEFMINCKIPRQERDTAPLLVCGDEIVWVVGYRLDARYAITERTRRALVVRVERVGVC